MLLLALPAFCAVLQNEYAGACMCCVWHDAVLTSDKPMSIGCLNCFQSNTGKGCLDTVCNASAAQKAEMRKELFRLFGQLDGPLLAFQ